MWHVLCPLHSIINCHYQFHIEILLEHLISFWQINPCTANGNPCANGATCVALQQGRFKCECLPGWEGLHCEINTGKHLCNSSAMIILFTHHKHWNLLLDGTNTASIRWNNRPQPPSSIKSNRTMAHYEFESSLSVHTRMCVCSVCFKSTLSMWNCTQ
jgi:hypothetical protein